MCTDDKSDMSRARVVGGVPTGSRENGWSAGASRSSGRARNVRVCAKNWMGISRLGLPFARRWCACVSHGRTGCGPRPRGAAWPVAGRHCQKAAAAVPLLCGGGRAARSLGESPHSWAADPVIVAAAHRPGLLRPPVRPAHIRRRKGGGGAKKIRLYTIPPPTWRARRTDTPTMEVTRKSYVHICVCVCVSVCVNTDDDNLLCSRTVYAYITYTVWPISPYTHRAPLRRSRTPFRR